MSARNVVGEGGAKVLYRTAALEIYSAVVTNVKKFYTKLRSSLLVSDKKTHKKNPLG